VIRFALIGALATVLHWVAAMVAIDRIGTAPLVANAMGWLCAFAISFLGHFWVTFRGHGAPLCRSMVRFACVSAIGFAMSTLVFAQLVRLHPSLYGMWLALTLMMVAFVSYQLGRRWAFSQR